MKLLILTFLLSISAYAQQRQSLYKKPEVTIVQPTLKVLSTKKAKVKSQSPNGNLSTDMLSAGRVSSIDESVVILPSKPSKIAFNQIKPGDIIKATIMESAFAFNNSKAPIRALINSGPLKGSVLLGEANLEQNSKRTTIEFKKFISPIQKEIYQLSAQALDEMGILGIKGKLISQEDKFFLSEFLSAGAAGYVDSTIQRDQNVFGNQTETKNEETFAKKALVSALSKTTDHFAEKLKQAPEYSILEGPIDIQILIIEQPKLNNE